MHDIHFKKSSLLVLALLILLIPLRQSCLISGQQIGKCRSKSIMDPQSFCYEYLPPYVCLPQDRMTWASYDELYRDQSIEQIFMTTLQQKFIQEYQDPWTSNIISNNLQCYYAYKKFICAWNFPSCQIQTNKTIVLCKSVCEEFFTNCQGNTEICEVVYESKDLGLDPQC